MKKPKLYKVLVNGKSCHGGNMTWDLPKQIKGKWKPGKWHSYLGNLEICASGLHLTSDYSQWIKHGCEVYEAEGNGDCTDFLGNKKAFQFARLLKPMKLPDWWINAEKFTASIKAIPYLKPDKKPDPLWKLYPTRDVARDAAWGAARDAALFAMILVSGIEKESKHYRHVLARMNVWEKGYGLLCDVGGVLFVYESLI